MAHRRDGTPVALVTDLSTGLQTLATAQTEEGGFGLTAAQRARTLAMLAEGRSGVLIFDDSDECGDINIEGEARLLVVSHVPSSRQWWRNAGRWLKRWRASRLGPVVVRLSAR